MRFFLFFEFFVRVLLRELLYLFPDKPVSGIRRSLKSLESRIAIRPIKVCETFHSLGIV